MILLLFQLVSCDVCDVSGQFSGSKLGTYCIMVPSSHFQFNA